MISRAVVEEDRHRGDGRALRAVGERRVPIAPEVVVELGAVSEEPGDEGRVVVVDGAVESIAFKGAKVRMLSLPVKGAL